MKKFKSVYELITELKPSDPVYCIRKKSIIKASKYFIKNFPGKILYAVKTNPNKEVVKTLIESGIKNFDVASIKEIQGIKEIDSSLDCSYMHTVKSREDIRDAYFKFGVKAFSLDTKDELIKILETTNHANDLELYVRIAVSNEHAEIDLSKKFGVNNNEAPGLIRLANQYTKKLGLSFHVGSQCMHPISYTKGITEIGNLIKKTKIIPKVINIGGGFPTIYPDLIPQSLNSYFEEIKKSLVNLRKKQKLYINDGTYGTLFDGGVPNIVYPSRLITNGRMISKKMTAFDFYGPTCDSMDYMKGPFILPNNIKENDYIELGQLGAYGLTFRTQFNGFYSDKIFEVEDEPIMTMYDKDKSKSYLVA